MIINSNHHQLGYLNQIRKTNILTQQVMEKLSSGKRINKAADDAAGLSISTRMNTQIRGNEKGKTNMDSGLSLVRTADGALGSIENQLQRMRELAIQAKNGTYSNQDKESIEMELKNLSNSIEKIAQTTEFNGKKILNFMGGVKFDGNNDRIRIANNSNMNLTDKLTMEAWINPTNVSGTNVIVGKEDSYIMAVINGQIRTAIHVNGTWSYQNTGVTVQANEWSHVAVSYDGTNIKTYLNGVEKSNIPHIVSGGGNVDNSGSALYIGDRGPFYEYFNGTIGDVRIWKSERTQEEISSNRMNGVDPDSNDLVGYWKMDDGTGNIVKDYSANGNNGTIQHGPATYPPDPLTDVLPQWDNAGGKINIHTDNEANSTKEIKLSYVRIDALGIDDIDVTDNQLIEKIDAALDVVVNERVKYGTYENSLQERYDHVSKSTLEAQKANSRIEDADIAKEMSESVRNKIILTSSMNILVQSNQQYNDVLQLLK